MLRLTLGKKGLICALAVASLPVLSQQTLPDGPKPKEQQSPQNVPDAPQPKPQQPGQFPENAPPAPSMRTLSSQKPRQPQRPQAQRPTARDERCDERTRRSVQDERRREFCADSRAGER